MAYAEGGGGEMRGRGEARHLAACAMIGRTNIAASRPFVFSSHSRQTIIPVERVGGTPLTAAVNRLASGASFNPNLDDVYSARYMVV